MHNDEFIDIPPKYQALVPPSPISISAAVFRVFSFRDLQVPKIPLIFSYFETLMFIWQAIGKGKSPSSVV